MEQAINKFNGVTINGKLVGHVNHTKQGYNYGPKYQIFTALETGEETKIFEPAYVGGGSKWALNDGFFSEVKASL